MVCGQAAGRSPVPQKLYTNYILFQNKQSLVGKTCVLNNRGTLVCKEPWKLVLVMWYTGYTSPNNFINPFGSSFVSVTLFEPVSFFWQVIGLALVGLAIYLLASQNDLRFLTGSEIGSGAVLILIAGLITAAIAFIGVLGAVGMWPILLIVVSVVMSGWGC